MKLEQVTKREKGSKIASKKVEDDIMPIICDAIVIVLIYG